MAVWNSTIVVSSHDGFVYAIDAETRRVKWEFETFEGLASSPAIAGGKVYFSGVDGSIFGVDHQTGEQEWVFRPVP